MQVLNSEDRDALLEFLRENASDSVLVAAVSDTKSEREHIRNQFLSLTKYMGARGGSVAEGLSSARPITVAAMSAHVAELVTKVNDSTISDPPGEPCTKIGSNTRADLLARCRTPMLPEVIGRAYYPHLKLLWKRGEITWNGSHYQTREGVR